MRILSIRRGFASDHSSTSYEFLAVDKPLGKKEREDVSRLSSRANPTARRVDFIYHVDGYDIPGGWENLMMKYYDVMYKEEYSWWTLAIAFDADDKKYKELCAYEFDGSDDLGIRIERKDKRLVIEIYCVIGEAPDLNGSYYSEYEDEDDSAEGIVVATGDILLDTIAEIRKQIIKGDYRALFAVWEVYGIEDDEDGSKPPQPKAKKSGAKMVKAFKDMLSTM